MMSQAKKKETDEIKKVLYDSFDMLLEKIETQSKRIEELDSKLDFTGGFQEERGWNRKSP